MDFSASSERWAIVFFFVKFRMVGEGGRGGRGGERGEGEGEGEDCSNAIVS